ncbi:hypothetical protein AKJ29_13900 [Aliiroseovarius crassostreae]|uniref:Uncharacterized protein n=1 Tax=Aliiroseovarius crassostreae TaxID=154981 RepID=A0A0N8IBP8_9RHOB|nr:hypothetical protein AKJ29_13900 [Aliiroseovarius crassostreae]
MPKNGRNQFRCSFVIESIPNKTTTALVQFAKIELRHPAPIFWSTISWGEGPLKKGDRGAKPLQAHEVSHPQA